MHFIAQPARHELGTTLPINPGSNFARFLHRIPPLMVACRAAGRRDSSAVDGWVGTRPCVRKLAGWVIARQSQAVARLAASLASTLLAELAALASRLLLLLAPTCCLELEAASDVGWWDSLPAGSGPTLRGGR